MEPLFVASRFAKYLLTARTPHGVHSPFVFELVSGLLREKTPYYAFRTIEKTRNSLLQDNRPVKVTDFGTGKDRNRISTVKEIASRQLLPARYGQLLFKIVNRFQPANVLELGTSLGITTLYLAAANTKSRIITLEGSDGTAEIAEQLFDRFNAKSIEVRKGEFSATLTTTLQSLGKVDFMFIDGNHCLEPTIRYFESALPHCHTGTILVFDDIHWSKEMEQEWNIIRSHERVTLSIDLFRLGIVFFREGRRKEHFTLKY